MSSPAHLIPPLLAWRPFLASANERTMKRDGSLHLMAPFKLMGVINVTPDSFSDGGAFIDPDAAVTHGRQLVAEGADILDIGGESTRPGADPVSEDEELWRVVPVFEGLKDAGAALSIDTMKP